MTGASINSDNANDPSLESKPHVEHGSSHKPSKKRIVLDDDFFSLSRSFEKKKKRKHTHKNEHQPVSGGVPTPPATDGVPSKEAEAKTIKVETSQADASPLLVPRAPAAGSHENVQEADPTQPVEIESVDYAEIPAAMPIIDTDRIRREIELKLGSVEYQEKADILDDSEEENYCPDTKPKPTPGPAHASSTTSSYNFDIPDEKKRKYVIRVSSKLPTPQGSSTQVDFGCKGMKSFEKILQSAVDFFKKSFQSQLPPELLNQYTFENTALVWVEGRTLIHSYYTPRFLRLPLPGGQFNPSLDKIEDLPATMLQVLLIPAGNRTNFTSVYTEFTTTTTTADGPAGSADAQGPRIQGVADEKEEEENISSEDEELVTTAPGIPEPESIDDEVFTIGLKGKDNKRIQCNVKPDTKLQSILLFFLRSKDIDPKSIDVSKARLIFDDEDLDINLSVKDTELEEDFEIQIVL
ncbi:uncharacterized protein LODBEIA_P06900 [Lodderomyces beijingensis]|uniref:Rad60/SUMO-like domain-containing protein n=1 Tax=Lodderomyces beijingensis TaxID=1775926 RepID=A0ABP0ZI33_9ASCO